MKVKVFSKSGGYFTRDSKILARLEQEINSWLESTKDIKVVDIKQSACGGSVEPAKYLVSIWYEIDH